MTRDLGIVGRLAIGSLLLASAVLARGNLLIATGCALVGVILVGSGLAAQRRARALATVMNLAEEISVSAGPRRAPTSPVTNRLVDLDARKRAGLVDGDAYTRERWAILSEV